MPAATGHKTHGRRDANGARRVPGICCVHGGAPTTQNRSLLYASGFVHPVRDATGCTAVAGGCFEVGCRGSPRTVWCDAAPQPAR